jgi:hypothetical protein
MNFNILLALSGNRCGKGVPDGTMLDLLELLKRAQALGNWRGSGERIPKRKRLK